MHYRLIFEHCSDFVTSVLRPGPIKIPKDAKQFIHGHASHTMQCLVDHSEHVYYFVGISSPFMQFRW